MSDTTSLVSLVSHCRPGNASLMLPAKFLSETPSEILLFLPVVGRLSSRKFFRKSEAMPSEMS
jgi:hypothetical protein